MHSVLPVDFNYDGIVDVLVNFYEGKTLKTWIYLGTKEFRFRKPDQDRQDRNSHFSLDSRG